MEFDFEDESEESETEKANNKENYEIEETGRYFCKIRSILSTFPFGVLNRNDADAVKRIANDILKQEIGIEAYLAGNCILSPFNKQRTQQYNGINLIAVGSEEIIEKRYLDMKRYSMEKEPRCLIIPGKRTKRRFSVEEINVENTDYEYAFSVFEWTSFSSLFYPNPCIVTEYHIENWKFEEMKNK